MKHLLVFVLLLAGVFVSPSPASAVEKARLTVATFNVCKATCQEPAPSWAVRRARVARVIVESDADVVGLQEATEQPTPDNKSQWRDIQALVAPQGYFSPKLGVNECAYKMPCTHTATILMRSSTVSQVSFPNGMPSAGSTTMGRIAPGMDSSSSLRQVTWAYLQTPAAGVFLVVSAHSPTEKDPILEASRVLFAQSFTPWVDALNASHGLPAAPVILLADLNSYAARQPAGGQFVLETSGWTDSIVAPIKVASQYASINHQPGNENPWHGFPPSPWRYRKPPATRIDYVFTRGLTPLSHEVVIRLLPDGTFNPEYQASDHQMVKAVLSFPAA